MLLLINIVFWHQDPILNIKALTVFQSPDGIVFSSFLGVLRQVLLPEGLPIASLLHPTKFRIGGLLNTPLE